MQAGAVFLSKSNRDDRERWLCRHFHSDGHFIFFLNVLVLSLLEWFLGTYKKLILKLGGREFPKKEEKVLQSK